MNYGVFEGLTWEEAKEKCPEIYKERLQNVYDHKVPKGESFKELWQRVHKKILEIERKYPKGNILIVGHGGAKIVMLMNFLNKTFDEVRKDKIKNASLTIFNIEKGKVEFRTINDGSHLM